MKSSIEKNDFKKIPFFTKREKEIDEKINKKIIEESRKALKYLEKN